MKPIYLIGYMGAGKSTVGKKLAEHLAIDFIDSDLYIENRFRKRIIDLFAIWGEETFRKREAVVAEELSWFENVVISTGGGLPIYHNNMDRILESGISIYLQTSEDVLYNRLSLCKQTRPSIRHLEGDALREFIKTNLELRHPIYSKANIIVDVSHINCDDDEYDFVKELALKLKPLLNLDN